MNKSSLIVILILGLAVTSVLYGFSSFDFKVDLKKDFSSFKFNEELFEEIINEITKNEDPLFLDNNLKESVSIKENFKVISMTNSYVVIGFLTKENTLIKCNFSYDIVPLNLSTNEIKLTFESEAVVLRNRFKIAGISIVNPELGQELRGPCSIKGLKEEYNSINSLKEKQVNTCLKQSTLTTISNEKIRDCFLK